MSYETLLRSVGKLASLLKCIVICSLAAAFGHAQMGTPDLARYVNPFIGTGEGAPDYSMGSAAGNTPPGAAYPFGMALWSPDTTSRSGGYRFDQKSIQGFSITHFSGRGISCWQDLPFMPVPGPMGTISGANSAAYASTFSHAGTDSAADNEQASPGFYSVKLHNGVHVELTVTQRTGLGRFTFSNSERGTL